MQIQEDLCRKYNLAPDRARALMHSQRIGFLLASSMYSGIKEMDVGERANALLAAVTLLSAYFRLHCGMNPVKTTEGDTDATGALVNALEYSAEIADQL